VQHFYQEVQRRIEVIPGVRGAGVIAAGLPLERGGNDAVGIVGEKESQRYSVDYREITPQFFFAMGIPLREGRLFADSDTDTSNSVVIVNEAFVRAHFPGRSAVGQHLYVDSKVPSEIVGVVADVKSNLDQPAPPTAFIPAAQAQAAISNLFEGWFPRTLIVRTGVDPLSLERQVREAFTAVDSTIPMGHSRSMDQVLQQSLVLRNFMRVLLSFFAALALLLASVGIYGVISYAVSQRTREIGVRIALGAQRADVLGIVLKEGLKLTAAGAVLGLAAAFALTRLLGSLLYNVSTTDPYVFALGTALLVAVAVAACYIPARRAMRVDPIVALRYE